MRHTVNVQVNTPQRVFYALASLPRRRIIAFLSQTALSTADLAERFAMSRPAISRHLSVLERAGLIARGREAQWRPCRIEAAPLKAVADWTARYRHMWEARLDRLDVYVQQMKVREEKRHGRQQRRK
jgi:DNA-binding transcriptional ArsR family regulator